MLAVGIALLWGCASQERQPPPFPAVGSYREIFTAMDAARERAIAEDKLVLFVMGANWCHDSLGFVTKTDDPRFRKLIDQRYVLQLINIGDLEYVREVINHYGEPVIYGTPTVMVVEPVSDSLLNRATLPYWRDAEMISMSDTLAYFRAFEPGQRPPATAVHSPALTSALAEIDRFERRQAERIYAAYDELGRMMKQLSGVPPSPEFLAKWDNLAAMRGRITGDLERLRADASDQDSAGVDPIELSFPRYELFTDAP